MPSSRAKKTLGWFLQDDLLLADKKVSISGVSSMKTGERSPEEKKRRRGPRRNSRREFPETTPSEGSAPSEADVAEYRQHSAAGEVDPAKEDFCYYDVASDGYYYEQNGARGWRRRMPNSVLQRIKEHVRFLSDFGKLIMDQENAQLAAGGGSVKPTGVASSAAIQQQLLAHALLAQQMYQPAFKYYDPNSDGFFYEMASVDGWKRRQPRDKPVAAGSRVAPHSMSYGAALARGQLPANYVIDDSSTSSSVSEDVVASDGLDFLSRPTTLAMPKKEAQFLPEFNADKFIQDLSFSGMNPDKMLSLTNSRTPLDAWSRWGFSPPEGECKEEDNMDHLLQGLENIWATPTPVNNK